MTDNRREILDALGQREGLVGIPLPALPAAPRLAPHELPRLLARRLRAHGATCLLTQDHAQTFEILADQLYTAGVKHVVVGTGEVLEELDLAARLAAALSGVKIHRPGDLAGDAWEEIEVGITDSAALWAETGTVVIDALSRDALLTSLLPSWHVVLGDDTRLFRDAPSWYASLDEAARARPRVTLQGPSRTADIEKRLVLGVHGPHRVTAFVAVGKLLDFQDPADNEDQGDTT